LPKGGRQGRVQGTNDKEKKTIPVGFTQKKEKKKPGETPGEEGKLFVA